VAPELMAAAWRVPFTFDEDGSASARRAVAFDEDGSAVAGCVQAGGWHHRGSWLGVGVGS
jgi:hypothetical protein